MSDQIPKNEEELLKNLQERWSKVEENFTALAEVVENSQAVKPEEGSDKITVDTEMFLVLRGLADLTIGEAFKRLILKQKEAKTAEGEGCSTI